MSKTNKDKWFGKCKLCEEDDKQLLTIVLTGVPYSISLKRVCQECRQKVLFDFYASLARRNIHFLETAEKFRGEV